ncbi:MAG TPA: cupin domain-containing protein, partial [Variovorax sp.]|nr:cupin domain-containing protein [Variovorax sp.]
VTSDTPVKLLVIYSPPYAESPDKLRRPAHD